MDWKRGLLRVWIVLSGAWAAFVIGYTINHDYGLWTIDTLFGVLLLPVPLFIVGASIYWAISGFRGGKK